MPEKLPLHEKEEADLAWNEAVISVVGTALRTADQYSEQLVGTAEMLAAHVVEWGGVHEQHSYRLALVKALHIAVGEILGTLVDDTTGDRKLEAVAENETPQVRAVLETALGRFHLGLLELIRALTYPEDTLPELAAVLRAAIQAVRVRLAMIPDEEKRLRAVAEIMAKVGR